MIDVHFISWRIVGKYTHNFIVAKIIFPLYILGHTFIMPSSYSRTISMKFITNFFPSHIVNISVTRRLLEQGAEVPAYFQIGMWPSVEMAIDYLAWGFFVGLAFAAVALSIDRANSKLRGIRITFFVNAALCLAGFLGAVCGQL